MTERVRSLIQTWDDFRSTRTVPAEIAGVVQAAFYAGAVSVLGVVASNVPPHDKDSPEFGRLLLDELSAIGREVEAQIATYRTLHNMRK